MLERPSRLRFAVPNSVYVHQYRYDRASPLKFAIGGFILLMIPYLSVRTYNRLDRLGYWESRIEQKRVRKMAFDFMLKSQAEKERDLIEEYSDF